MPDSPVPMGASPVYIRLADEKSRIALEIPDLAAFENQLGEGVLAAFCRCFVHADRLTSLAHFISFLERCPPDSVAVTRDYYTMAWFSLGTLREYAKGLRELKSACTSTGLLNTAWEEWQALFAFEKRWDGDGKLVKLRSQIAFHVDPDNELIPAGLRSMRGRTVTVFLSDKPSVIDARFGSWYRLGMEALLDGYGVPRDDFVEVFKKVAADMSVNNSLYDLFRRILDNRGVKLVRQDVIADQPSSSSAPTLRQRLASTTFALAPWALLLTLKRAFLTRYIVFRMWVIDEELSRIRDKALLSRRLFDDPDILQGLRAQPRFQELQFERMRLEKLTYRFGEVYGLKLDRRLRRKALRYGVVSIPEGQAYHTTSKITDAPRLNAHGVAKVRKDIRTEKQARREPWLAWLPWILAIGAAIGWIHAVFFRQPPSP